MLLRSRNRLKPTEKSLKGNSHPENVFSPENKSSDMKVSVTSHANKMLKKMNKSDLQSLVVRLCAEIKRLHKVHYISSLNRKFRNRRLLFSF